MAQKQIDDLYIDVTSADIPDIRLRRKAVNDIEAIVRCVVVEWLRENFD